MADLATEAGIAVLGASGFVGGHVCAALARHGRFRPIAVVRRPATAVWETRVCDATNAASLRQTVEDASAIVNCVAGNAATMVAATSAVAACAGERRVVHLSSMAVYGPQTGLIAETAPVQASGWYATAKATSEQALRDLPNAVCLRPGCIHGPGSEPWTARIGRLLRQGRIGDLGPAGDGTCNLIFIDDVAAAILAALTHTALPGRFYNLADPDPGTWNDYFVRFALAIGATPVRRIHPRTLKLESKLLAPALKIGQLLAARARLAHTLPDPLPPSLLALWQQDITLDHRAADHDLGFARTPQPTALAAAAQWFCEHEGKKA